MHQKILSVLGDRSKYFHKCGYVIEFRVPVWIQPACTTDVSALAKKKMSLSQIGILARQLFQGLQYLHAEGIIHRDVTPSNILISGGRVRIADFDFATWDAVAGFIPKTAYPWWDKLSCSGILHPSVDVMGGLLTLFHTLCPNAQVGIWSSHQPLQIEASRMRVRYDFARQESLPFFELIASAVHREKTWASQAIGGLICHFANVLPGELKERLSTLAGRCILAARYRMGVDEWMLTRIKPIRAKILQAISRKERGWSGHEWWKDVSDLVYGRVSAHWKHLSWLERVQLDRINAEGKTLYSLPSGFILTQSGWQDWMPIKPLPLEVMRGYCSLNPEERRESLARGAEFFPTATTILNRLESLQPKGKSS